MKSKSSRLIFKAIFILPSLFSFAEAFATTYTFNFGTGKETNWSNVNNWQGANYPSALVQDDSIVISPPNASTGWVCHLDQSFSVTAVTIIIKKNTSFYIDSLKTLSLNGTQDGFTNYGSVLNIEASAACRIKGGINASASNISSYGDLLVEKGAHCYLGEVELGEDFFVGSSIVSHGSFTNKGMINFHAYGGINADEMNNEDTIKLGYGNTSFDICNLSFGRLNNTGSISGNSTIYVSGLLINKGSINLNIDYTKEVATLYGVLENYGHCGLAGVCNISANLINTGSFSAYGTELSINGNIQNAASSSVSFDSPVLSLAGFITNAGDFYLFSSDNPFGVFTCNINLINSGTFFTQNLGGLYFQTGSVINSNQMELDGEVYIDIPFINKGTLTTYGDVHTGNAFINAGIWNNN